MIVLRLGSRRPSPGSDSVVMVSTTPLVASPSPLRRDIAPNCEVGASPHVPRGWVVVVLRRTQPRQLDDQLTSSTLGAIEHDHDHAQRIDRRVLDELHILTVVEQPNSTPGPGPVP